MNHPRIIFFSCCLLICSCIQAQTPPSIKVSISKNRILLGEPFTMTIQGTATTQYNKEWLSLDSIPHFEISDRKILDSSSGGITRITALYTLTSFDSGHWVIPAFSIAKGIHSDTLPVDIVFSDFDPAQDYHDIKDIIEVKPPPKKEWWYYAVAGALVLAAALYLIFRKKKVVKKAAPPGKVDPYREAMEALEQLKHSNSDPKTYYSGLTDIFRLYVFRKKGILSLQKTMDDLMIQLKGLGLSTGIFENLSQSLRLSDFVKFAKYVPSKEDDAVTFDHIRNAIVTIQEMEKQTQTTEGKN